jgi:hypothetical protein
MSEKSQSATWRHGLATSGLAAIPDIGRGRQHVREVPLAEVVIGVLSGPFPARPRRHRLSKRTPLEKERHRREWSK